MRRVVLWIVVLCAAGCAPESRETAAPRRLLDQPASARPALETRVIDCVVVTHVAWIADARVQIYARNTCPEAVSAMSWHWSQRSSVGYIVAEDMTLQCPAPAQPGTESICQQDIRLHPRAARMVVFTKRTQ